MIKVYSELRSTTEETITHLEKTCNKCGKIYSHDVENDPKASIYTFDANIHSITIEHKYGNVNDGIKLNFELCQDCLNELIGSFVVEPYIEI